MGKAPSFQFYPKQWLGDDKVMLMDWDARGMHLQLMCIAWQQDEPCTLPDDDEIIKKWLGNPKRWNELKKQIFRAWKLKNGRWIQEGLLREYNKQRDFSESRRKNALKRWEGKDNKNNASALQVHSKCDALQSSSSITKENTLKGIKEIPPLEYKKLVNDFSEEIILDYLERFKLYVKSSGKEFTDVESTIRLWLKRDKVKPMPIKQSEPEKPKPDYEAYRQKLLKAQPELNERFKEIVIDPLSYDLNIESWNSFICDIIVVKHDKKNKKLYLFHEQSSWINEHYMSRIELFLNENKSKNEIMTVEITSEVKE